MSIGTIPGKTLVAIADKLREKTNTTESITPEDMPVKIDNAYECGKKAEYDAFWDDFQQSGTRTDYIRGFASIGWTNSNFKPKYDIVAAGDATSMWQGAKITDLVSILNAQNVVFDMSQVTNAYMMFNSCRITHIPVCDARNSTNLQRMFNSCDAVIIDKLLVTSTQTFPNTFYAARMLTEIEIEGIIANDIDFQFSPLNAKSLVSIIEHLSDTTIGKKVSFKQSAIDTADWESTDYTSWYELVDTKPNWIVALI